MISDAVQSRCQDFDLTPPFEAVVKRVVDILKQENVIVHDKDKGKLVNLIKMYFPDIRNIIGNIDKRIIKGELIIDEVIQNYDFANKVYENIINKKSIKSIRQHIIQNCISFNNDYHQLLKGLFESVYAGNLSVDKKGPALMIISNAMLQHQQVMDVEINAYSCIIELVSILI